MNAVNQLKLNEEHVADRKPGATCARERESRDWFWFTFEWLRKWRECFKPITKRGDIKPEQAQIILTLEVKTALDMRA